MSTPLTCKDVENAITRLQKTETAYVALVLLSYPELPFEHSLAVSSDGKITCNDVSIDIPDTLSHLTEGIIFKDASGNAFPTKMKFARYINEFITKELNNPKATTSVIKAIYTTQPITYKVEYSQLEPIKKTEIRLDQDIRRHLKDYTFYVEQNNRGYYPFLLVHVEQYNLYMRYDIYRYVGQLAQSPRITDKLRLATVDHIYRDTKDNRRCSLRYVTAKQNLSNQCTKDMKQPFHGVDTKSSSHTHTLDQEVATKVIYWVNIISQVLPKVADKPQPKTLKIFSNTPCRKYTELESKLHFLDPLLFDLAEMLSNNDHTPADVYSTPDFDYKRHESIKYHKRIRALLEYTQGMSFKIMKTVRPEYVCALVNDLTRYVSHKEYSHTNFLQVPKPRVTLAECIKDLKDPITILNFYEPFISAETLEPLLIANGIPNEDVKGKIRFYERSGDIIKATLVPRKYVDITSHFTILDTISIDTMITSPNTLFSMSEPKK